MKTVGYYKEHKVALDSFYMDHTYGEYLLLPKSQLQAANQEIIGDHLKERVESIWGEDRPTFVARGYSPMS